MTRKSIWTTRWEKKARNVAKSTSLDAFAEKSFEVLRRYINQSDRTILEVGSGTGRFAIALAAQFPNKHITGIDYTDQAIELSTKGANMRNLSNVTFQKENLFKLPFKNNSFDCVYENGVIEHFLNYDEAIAEMKRVTKPGGKVIINVNNWYCFPKTIEKLLLGKRYPFGYEKSFKHKEVTKALKDQNLEKIRVFAYNPFNTIVRFFLISPPLKKGMVKLTNLFEIILNILTFNRFSSIFGYMT